MGSVAHRLGKDGGEFTRGVRGHGLHHFPVDDDIDGLAGPRAAGNHHAAVGFDAHHVEIGCLRLARGSHVVAGGVIGAGRRGGIGAAGILALGRIVAFASTVACTSIVACTSVVALACVRGGRARLLLGVGARLLRGLLVVEQVTRPPPRRRLRAGRRIREACLKWSYDAFQRLLMTLNDCCLPQEPLRCNANSHAMFEPRGARNKFPMDGNR